MDPQEFGLAKSLLLNYELEICRRRVRKSAMKNVSQYKVAELLIAFRHRI